MDNKKMGRPTKTEIKRDKQLTIRLTEKELELIGAVASKLGKTRADAIVYAIGKLA